MKRVEAAYSYDILDRSELSVQEYDDLQRATEARNEADTHVSGFGVGALVRMNNGETAIGWNWETDVQNTTHAERNAIVRLTKKGRESGLKRVTVMGGMVGKESEETVAPCGCCQQDLIYLMKPDTEPLVIMAGTRGLIKRIKLVDLVPLLFDLNRFKKQ